MFINILSSSIQPLPADRPIASWSTPTFRRLPQIPLQKYYEIVGRYSGAAPISPVNGRCLSDTVSMSGHREARTRPCLQIHRSVAVPEVHPTTSPFPIGQTCRACLMVAGRRYPAPSAADAEYGSYIPNYPKAVWIPFRSEPHPPRRVHELQGMLPPPPARGQACLRALGGSGGNDGREGRGRPHVLAGRRFSRLAQSSPLRFLPNVVSGGFRARSPHSLCQPARGPPPTVKR